MSTFCQHSYHRKCQRRGVGGQKNPKSCQRYVVKGIGLTSLSCTYACSVKNLQQVNINHIMKSQTHFSWKENEEQTWLYQPQFKLSPKSHDPLLCLSTRTTKWKPWGKKVLCSSYYSRAVGTGGDRPPSDFGRSVNPIKGGFFSERVISPNRRT